MAENIPAIFGKNLVDLTGLNSFWTAAKKYIDGQIDATEELVNGLSTGQVTTNKNDIAGLKETLSDAGIGTNGALSDSGTIKTAITTAVNGLANGQVTTNKNNIAALTTTVNNLSGNLNTNVDGRIDAKLNPVIEDVNQNTQDISGINTKLSKAGIGTNGALSDSGTIKTAINSLANGQVKANTEAIAGLTETVGGHTNTLASHTESINGMPAVMDGKINTFKAGLKHTNSGAAGAGKYVSKVEQANGAVTVTYATLPDPTGEITEKCGETLEAAKAYTDGQLASHTAVEDTYKTDTVNKTGKIHVSAQDRYNWDVAATRIDTFLNSVTDNSVIDTLTEINNWFTQYGGNYDTLLGVVNGHTNSIESNLEKINTINTNLATITIATPQACADIVK